MNMCIKKINWGLAILSTTLVSCSDSFMKSTARSKTANVANLSSTLDAAGNVSASLDPYSTSTQVLKITSGSLAGAGVAFPVGSLSGAFSVTFGEGETLASSGFTQSLGITDNTVTAAGPSISIASSSAVETTSPFTLSLPVSSTTLALASINSENLVVMYRWIKVTDGVASNFMGIIPRKDVVVGATTVAVSTTKFGVFQLAISANKITEKVSKPSLDPPAPKGDASNPLVGNWELCKKDNPIIQFPSGAPTSTQTTTQIWTPSNNQAANINWTQDQTIQVGMTSSDHLFISPTVHFIPDSFGNIMSNAINLSIGFSCGNNVPSTSGVLNFNSNNNGGAPSLYLSYFPSCNYSDVFNLWAPNQCHFRSVSTGKISFFIPLFDGATYLTKTANSIYWNYILGSGSDMTIECDGMDRGGFGPPELILSESSQQTTSSSTTNNYSSGGGDDQIGTIDGVSYYRHEIAKITPKTYTHIAERFQSDTGCSGPMVSKVVETGSYELQKVDVAGTLPINLKTTTKAGTLFDQKAIETANNDPIGFGCGYSNWTQGVSQDLLNAPNCKEDQTIHYTRFKIEGKNLYGCDDHNKDGTSGSNGSTPESRVADCSIIDKSGALVRQ